MKKGNVTKRILAWVMTAALAVSTFATDVQVVRAAEVGAEVMADQGTDDVSAEDVMADTEAVDAGESANEQVPAEQDTVEQETSAISEDEMVVEEVEESEEVANEQNAFEALPAPKMQYLSVTELEGVEETQVWSSVNMVEMEDGVAHFNSNDPVYLKVKTKEHSIPWVYLKRDGVDEVDESANYLFDRVADHDGFYMISLGILDAADYSVVVETKDTTAVDISFANPFSADAYTEMYRVNYDNWRPSLVIGERADLLPNEYLRGIVHYGKENWLLTATIATEDGEMPLELLDNGVLDTFSFHHGGKNAQIKLEISPKKDVQVKIISDENVTAGTALTMEKATNSVKNSVSITEGMNQQIQVDNGCVLWLTDLEVSYEYDDDDVIVTTLMKGESQTVEPKTVAINGRKLTGYEIEAKEGMEVHVEAVPQTVPVRFDMPIGTSFNAEEVPPNGRFISFCPEDMDDYKEHTQGLRFVGDIDMREVAYRLTGNVYGDQFRVYVTEDGEERELSYVYTINAYESFVPKEGMSVRIERAGVENKYSIAVEFEDELDEYVWFDRVCSANCEAVERDSLILEDGSLLFRNMYEGTATISVSKTNETPFPEGKSINNVVATIKNTKDGATVKTVVGDGSNSSLTWMFDLKEDVTVTFSMSDEAVGPEEGIERFYFEYSNDDYESVNVYKKSDSEYIKLVENSALGYGDVHVFDVDADKSDVRVEAKPKTGKFPKIYKGTFERQGKEYFSYDAEKECYVFTIQRYYGSHASRYYYRMAAGDTAKVLVRTKNAIVSNVDCVFISQELEADNYEEIGNPYRYSKTMYTLATGTQFPLYVDQTNDNGEYMNLKVTATTKDGGVKELSSVFDCGDGNLLYAVDVTEDLEINVEGLDPEHNTLTIDSDSSNNVHVYTGYKYVDYNTDLWYLEKLDEEENVTSYKSFKTKETLFFGLEETPDKKYVVTATSVDHPEKEIKVDTYRQSVEGQMSWLYRLTLEEDVNVTIRTEDIVDRNVTINLVGDMPRDFLDLQIFTENLGQLMIMPTSDRSLTRSINEMDPVTIEFKLNDKHEEWSSGVDYRYVLMPTKINGDIVTRTFDGLKYSVSVPLHGQDDVVDIEFQKVLKTEKYNSLDFAVKKAGTNYQAEVYDYIDTNDDGIKDSYEKEGKTFAAGEQIEFKGATRYLKLSPVNEDEIIGRVSLRVGKSEKVIVPNNDGYYPISFPLDGRLTGTLIVSITTYDDIKNYGISLEGVTGNTLTVEATTTARYAIKTTPADADISELNVECDGAAIVSIKDGSLVVKAPENAMENAGTIKFFTQAGQDKIYWDDPVYSVRVENPKVTVNLTSRNMGSWVFQSVLSESGQDIKDAILSDGVKVGLNSTYSFFVNLQPEYMIQVWRVAVNSQTYPNSIVKLDRETNKVTLDFDNIRGSKYDVYKVLPGDEVTIEFIIATIHDYEVSVVEMPGVEKVELWNGQTNLVEKDGVYTATNSQPLILKAKTIGNTIPVIRAEDDEDFSQADLFDGSWVKDENGIYTADLGRLFGFDKFTMVVDTIPYTRVNVHVDAPAELDYSYTSRDYGTYDYIEYEESATVTLLPDHYLQGLLNYDSDEYIISATVKTKDGEKTLPFYSGDEATIEFYYRDAVDADIYITITPKKYNQVKLVVDPKIASDGSIYFEYKNSQNLSYMDSVYYNPEYNTYFVREDKCLYLVDWFVDYTYYEQYSDVKVYTVVNGETKEIEKKRATSWGSETTYFRIDCEDGMEIHVEPKERPFANVHLDLPKGVGIWLQQEGDTDINVVFSPYDTDDYFDYAVGNRMKKDLKLRRTSMTVSVASSYDYDSINGNNSVQYRVFVTENGVERELRRCLIHGITNFECFTPSEDMTIRVERKVAEDKAKHNVKFVFDDNWKDLDSLAYHLSLTDVNSEGWISADNEATLLEDKSLVYQLYEGRASFTVTRDNVIMDRYPNSTVVATVKNSKGEVINALKGDGGAYWYGDSETRYHSAWMFDLVEDVTVEITLSEVAEPTIEGKDRLYFEYSDADFESVKLYKISEETGKLDRTANLVETSAIGNIHVFDVDSDRTNLVLLATPVDGKFPVVYRGNFVHQDVYPYTGSGQSEEYSYIISRRNENGNDRVRTNYFTRLTVENEVSVLLESEGAVISEVEYLAQVQELEGDKVSDTTAPIGYSKKMYTTGAGRNISFTVDTYREEGPIDPQVVVTMKNGTQMELLPVRRVDDSYGSDYYSYVYSINTTEDMSIKVVGIDKPHRKLVFDSDASYPVNVYSGYYDSANDWMDYTSIGFDGTTFKSYGMDSEVWYFGLQKNQWDKYTVTATSLENPEKEITITEAMTGNTGEKMYKVVLDEDIKVTIRQTEVKYYGATFNLVGEMPYEYLSIQVEQEDNGVTSYNVGDETPFVAVMREDEEARAYIDLNWEYRSWEADSDYSYLIKSVELDGQELMKYEYENGIFDSYYKIPKLTKASSININVEKVQKKDRFNYLEFGLLENSEGSYTVKGYSYIDTDDDYQPDTLVADGTVFTAGDMMNFKGRNKEISITPEEGYYIDKVLFKVGKTERELAADKDGHYNVIFPISRLLNGSLFVSVKKIETVKTFDFVLDGVKDNGLTVDVGSVNEYAIKTASAEDDISGMNLEVTGDIKAEIQGGKLIVTAPYKEMENAGTIKFYLVDTRTNEKVYWKDKDIQVKTVIPQALVGGTPKVDVLKTDDVSLTVQLTAPANVVPANGGRQYYKVTVTPEAAGSASTSNFGDGTKMNTIKAVTVPDSILQAVSKSFYIEKDPTSSTQIERIVVDTREEGRGQAWKYKVTVVLLQTKDMTELTAENEAEKVLCSSQGTAPKEAETKEPIYITSLKLVSPITQIYTLQNKVACAKVETDENAVLTEIRSVEDLSAMDEQALTLWEEGGVIYATATSDTLPGAHLIRVTAEVPDTIEAATAEMTIKVVKSIETIDVTPACERVLKLDNKAATMTFTTALNTGMTAPAKKTVSYSVVDVDGKDLTSASALYGNVTVAAGKVTIAKTMSVSDDETKNQFRVKVTAADYVGNPISAMTNVITVVKEPLDIAKVGLYSFDGATYKEIEDLNNITTDILEKAVVVAIKKGTDEKKEYSITEMMQASIENEMVTYKVSNKAVTTASTQVGMKLLPTKAVTGLKVTVTTADGGKKTGIIKLNILAKNEENLQIGVKDEAGSMLAAPGTDKVSFAGTVNTRLQLQISKISNGKDMPIDAMVNHQVTIKGGKLVVSDYVRGYYEFVVNGKVATLTLKNNSNKVTKTCVITNTAYSDESAPKIRMVNKLIYANTREQKLNLQFSGKASYDMVMIELLETERTKNAKNEELYSQFEACCDEFGRPLKINSNGGLTLHFGKNVPNGSIKVQVTLGSGATKEQFVATSKPASLTIKSGKIVVKKGKVTATSSYKLETSNTTGVALKVKGSNVSLLQLQELKNSTINGRTNDFKEYFDLKVNEDGVGYISLKAGITEAEIDYLLGDGKGNLTGYVSYRMVHGDDGYGEPLDEIKTFKVTIKLLKK